MAGKLGRLEDVDDFRKGLKFAKDPVSDEVVQAVRRLDERDELEPFIRSILTDSNETHHGPAEVVDILTHKVSVGGLPGIAAFILKGKSFSTVRPSHVAHQIYRLEKIADLSYAFFIATGRVLDEAKEQYISTATRTAVKYFILDAADVGRLLVGFGFLCPRDGRRVTAGRCSCGYSPERRILNVLQTETLKELRRAHSLGQTAGLVVLPPGTGKTRIAAEDAREMAATRVLYVAHSDEILDVAKSEFCAVFGEDNVSRWDVSSTASEHLTRVNLATIQSTWSRKHNVVPGLFDYLVIDEFHHAPAKSYRELIERCKPEFMLGLTATPFRRDRQSVPELCGNNTIVNFELRAGIDMGILTPYHYFGCFDDIDYSTIQRNGKDYSVRDLERKLIIPERDRAIIRKWKELADGAPTVAFCCSHKHAARVAESFREHGIPAEPYISLTDSFLRKDLQRKFASGKLRVLCTVDILNEGVDIPFIECLLFLRPTDSARIFYQQLGRGLRKAVGKTHCVAIDFIGNFKNAYRVVEYHGLLPDPISDVSSYSRRVDPKAILNLPLGCKVVFDDRVIDLFARQITNSPNVNRHNIEAILIYNYERLWRRLGRAPKAIEVDRNSWLNSELYRLVWGNWRKFEMMMKESHAM